MKDTKTLVEKKELSLAEIRTLMETKPTPCSITPRPAQEAPRSEDMEFYGCNADAAKHEFTEETGHTP